MEPALKMSIARQKIDNASSQRRQRSRLTNHKDLLPDIDGRSPAARRFRDLVNAFIADMGGVDQCSEIKIALIRRLAAATVMSETLEALMISQGKFPVEQLCLLASTAVRLSQRIGVNRVPRDVTVPHVAAYVDHVRRQEAPEEPAERPSSWPMSGSASPGPAHQRPPNEAGEPMDEGSEAAAQPS